MNRAFKRAIGLAGSAVLGLAGALALASTAEAQDPETPDESDVSLSATSDCVGMTVTAADNAEPLVTFTLKPAVGEPVGGTPAVGEELSEYFVIEDLMIGIQVEVFADGELIEVFDWEPGSPCAWGTVTETCEGLTYDLVGLSDAPETTFTLTPSGHPEDQQVLTLAPEETETVGFTPYEEDWLSVELVIETSELYRVYDLPWIGQLECEETPPPAVEESTPPAAGGQLPETGGDAAVMVGLAAAVLAAAGAALVIARRRTLARDW